MNSPSELFSLTSSKSSNHMHPFLDHTWVPCTQQHAHTQRTQTQQKGINTCPKNTLCNFKPTASGTKNIGQGITKIYKNIRISRMLRLSYIAWRTNEYLKGACMHREKQGWVWQQQIHDWKPQVVNEPLRNVGRRWNENLVWMLKGQDITPTCYLSATY